MVWWVGVMGTERASCDDFVRVEEPRTSYYDSDFDLFIIR